MGYWLANISEPRTEFAVRDSILELGAFAWVARKVEQKKVKGQRTPVPVISPLLSGYLFVACSDEQWHDIRANVRGLWPEMLRISPAYWERRLSPFIATNDQDYLSRMAAAAQGERLASYADGAELEVLVGALAGRRAIFRGVVEDDADDAPLRLIAEVPGFIGGKALQVTLSASDVQPLHH